MLSPEAIHWQKQSDEAGITQVSSLWSPAHSTQFRWHHTFQLTVAASNLEAKPDHWKDFFCHSHYHTCPSHNLTAEKTHHLPPEKKVQFQQPASISWVIPSDSHFPLGLSLTATICNGLIPDWNIAQAIWSVVSTANRWRWRPWVKALTSNSKHEVLGAKN